MRSMTAFEVQMLDWFGLLICIALIFAALAYIGDRLRDRRKPRKDWWLT